MLNSYERIVIESLLKKNRNLEDINHDTSLENSIIQNSLMSLLTKRFIKKELDLYCVILDQVKQYLTSKESLSDQLSEREILINSMLYKSCPLNFYKVHLSEKDQTILNGLLKNLENFFEEIQKKNNKSHSTKDEQIFILGGSNYVNTIKNIFS
jgi:hypothetical protein